MQLPHKQPLIALSFAAAVLAMFLASFYFQQAFAQSLPLPPPLPKLTINEEPHFAKDDKDPPVVQVLTTELKAGKNVFEVRIVDNSTVQFREVKYVHDGKIVSQGLNKDQNNVYKALIDIQPPSRIVVINAGDVYGHVTTVVKEYDVEKASSGSILDSIINAINNITKSLENMFPIR